jgi:membrane protease subunit (stomatin/prohibitin family)
MMRRRRPLMRAAMVGGAGYYAGKKLSEGRAETADREGDQEARLEALEQQQAQPQAAPAPPPAPAEDDTIEQLKKYKELHDAGVLTDEEFAAAKQKVLGV